MIGAMFVFTLMDAVAKVLTQEIGVWPTLWIRYLGQAVFGVSDRFAALSENCENLFSAAAIGAFGLFDVRNHVFLLGHFKHRLG